MCYWTSDERTNFIQVLALVSTIFLCLSSRFLGRRFVHGCCCFQLCVLQGLAEGLLYLLKGPCRVSSTY
ncbi:hypothetical protein PVAP13_5KG516107 [Panicum virgatum]|uniref:Uncharacterized protein n=1 Tax=Panicum virgatum TaxID=38727 RepID=A0A8T0ST49_PANVG|nr:hypothetical protein PVAP13_5KG516107 [Panicum virgatum]